MDRAFSMLAGAGIGAGLMYLLDPQTGRRRRALIRDQAVGVAHDASDAAGVVGRDFANKAKGLAHGDLSVLVGGKRAWENNLRGSWSPSARAIMGMSGAGMFAFGMTQDTPEACLLGTVGLLLMAEGVLNIGIDDLARVPEKTAELASDAARGLGFGRSDGEHSRSGRLVGAPM
jgi:hypothetical protein